MIHTVTSGFLRANLSTILVTYLTQIVRSVHSKRVGHCQ